MRPSPTSQSRSFCSLFVTAVVVSVVGANVGIAQDVGASASKEVVPLSRGVLGGEIDMGTLGSKTPESCAVPIKDNGDANSPAHSVAEVKSDIVAKALKPGLPTIGLLLYDHVLQTEITAPLDVFSKHSKDGEQLFNVITIAGAYELIQSEEGLKIFPDYTFDNAPKLDIIVVPSAYDMSARVNDERLVKFIQEQNKNTKYTVSNCGGASLIGEAGIADGRKIVTWIGGGKDLQKNYPSLRVQDDTTVSFVQDGKFLSSNGNLASYISALELLEEMTNKEHVKFVESYLYLERLQNWRK